MNLKIDVGRCVLIGAVTASIVGLLDAVWGLSIAATPLIPGALWRVIVLALTALVVPGAVFGALFAVGKHHIWDRISIRAALSWLRPRPGVTTLLSAGVLTLPALALALGYQKGIQIDAIDFRPLVFWALAIGMLTVGAVVIHAAPKILGIAGGIVAILTVAGVTFGLSRTQQQSAILPFVKDRTALIGPMVRAAQQAFDRDGDGYPRAICQRSCDCDDDNASRHPAALEIPGNGVDEDCSGGDLIYAKNSAGGSAPKGSVYVDRSTLSVPYNIVLITIDTLRADRMHMYGYERETTPHLDQLAKESVLFEQVRSQGPSTRFVFPVLLTGRYFSEVALKKGKKWYKLLPSNVTFAEMMKTKGYRTISVMPYFRFKEHSGFQQGFDVWESKLPGDRNATWDPTGDLVTERGISHLNALSREKGPWLLWLHYFDPHGAYVKHLDQPSFGTEKADLYDGEVRYVDRQVQRFLDELKVKGVFDRAAIVVASDHGEGIGLETDHGLTYHGFSLYDSETRIPLMFRVPGLAPRRVSECVGLIDLVPTLLELAGVTPPDTLHGHSLIPYLLGANPERGPFLMQLPEKDEQQAMVDWPFKLIWQMKRNRLLLFNLETDPNEQHDLAPSDPDRAAQMKKALQLMRYEITNIK